MEKYQFLPKGGIDDDIGADLNSHRTFKFSLSESNLEDCVAPEECTKLIRLCLQDNPSNKTSKPNTNKRLTSKEIAFPLEDSELFWNRMFEGKNSDVTAETNTHDPKSYITFNVKEGSEDKNEVIETYTIQTRLIFLNAQRTRKNFGPSIWKYVLLITNLISLPI